MNKKGAMGHIEIIISFVIFVSFLLFLFAVFPIIKPIKSQAGLNIAEESITENVSIELVSFTLALNESGINKIGSENCFKIDYVSNSNVIVKNEAGEIINASLENNKINIEKSGKFYTVYSAEDFIENSLNKACTDLVENQDFTKGLKMNQSVLSYKKILALNISYYEDYEAVHGLFNINKNEDFGFILRETNGQEFMSVMKSKPGKAEVLARNVYTQMAYENGTLKSIILNLQIW